MSLLSVAVNHCCRYSVRKREKKESCNLNCKRKGFSEKIMEKSHSPYHKNLFNSAFLKIFPSTFSHL